MQKVPQTTRREFDNFKNGRVKMFAGFRWPYSIIYQEITAGHTDQTTGDWIPETITEKTITGAIITIKEEELQRLDPGIFKSGDRKLLGFRADNILPGNRLIISEDGAGTETEWLIISKQESPRATFKSVKLDFDTFYLSRRT
jgi:hypothetical protein